MDSECVRNVQDRHHEAFSSLLRPGVSTNHGPKFGKRHSQSVILAVIIFFGYITRTVLSVAIVAMTDPTASDNRDIPTFNWTDKGIILSSFLWGYCIPQIGAGYVADRLGAKWFLVGTNVITAIVGLLIPTAVIKIGSKGLMACSFLQGLCQGFLYPSMQGLIGQWIPSNERSRLTAFIYSGAPIGKMVSMQCTGYISASRYGWPVVFYLFNSILLVICGLYAYAGSSNPNSHPTISKEEKRYIMTNLNTPDNRKKLQTPWKEIFTSPPFWALLANNVAFNWMQWALITQTSIYMKKVMNFDLKSNGVVSSLPYIAEYFVIIISSFVADFLIGKNILSTTVVRKMMSNIGLLVPAVSLYFLGNSGPDDVNSVVILIILVGGTHGTGRSGFLANYMDISPNFSGVMMGFTNTPSIVTSVFAPLLMYIIVKDEKNVGQWKITFYISMSIMIVGAIINTFFASAKRQVWNQGKKKDEGASNTIRMLT